MGKIVRLAALAVLGLALWGCAHNHPKIDSPTKLMEAPRARIYADINGNFFPDDWRDTLGEKLVARRHSLLAAIGEQAVTRQALFDFEAKFLADLERLSGRGKGKAYVFMVGFNADHASTGVQLSAMQDAVAIGPDDLVVEFYWDGHQAKALVDAAPVWFLATGNSQLVGSRGLRRVLDALRDREVLVVSYSRGASVVLSALSNPEYQDRFVEKTEVLSYLRGPPLEPLFHPPDLRPGKPIDVVMMAPAIGRPDFFVFAPDTAARTLRPFPARLRSLRYTINQRDRVLNKLFIGPTRFNSTELGARPQLGLELSCTYPWLHPYPVVSRFGHDGMDYIRDESYRRMLRDAGVPLRRPIDGATVGALTCPNRSVVAAGVGGGV